LHTPYTRGKNLITYFEFGRKKISRIEFSNLIRKILKAVKCIHDKGIYHLDLKPDNILYDGENVTLIDFESAHYGDKNGTCRLMDSIPMTPIYTLPSIVKDQQQGKFIPGIYFNGFKQDLYSLGQLIHILAPAIIEDYYDEYHSLISKMKIGRQIKNKPIKNIQQILNYLTEIDEENKVG
jgi:hypothetical protein